MNNLHSITLELEIFPLPLTAIRKIGNGNYVMGRLLGEGIHYSKKLGEIPPQDLRAVVLEYLSEAKLFTKEELSQKIREIIEERRKQETASYEQRAKEMREVFALKEAEIREYSDIFSHDPLSSGESHV